MNNKSNQKTTWDLKSIVLMGFALLFVLMAALIAIGLSSMKQNDNRLSRVINEQNAKLEQLTTMRIIGRERVILLFSTISTTDPFDVDTNLSKVDELASDFIVAQNKFLSLGLNPAEQANFSRASKVIALTAKKQGEVIDLIRNDQRAQAQEQLVSNVLPLQLNIFQMYNELINLQKTIAAKTIAEAKHDNDNTFTIMVFLAATTFLLGIIIAAIVLRRITLIENALFDEKELAEITLHSIADGVIVVNQLGLVTYLNPVAESLTGWSIEEAYNQPLNKIYNIVNESNRKTIDYAELLSRLEGPILGIGHNLLIRRDSYEFSIKDSAAPIQNRDSQMMGSVIVFNDVTEAHNLTQQLSWQASHDALTGLVNRREFDTKLRAAVSQQHNKKQQQTLLFLDLDKFKLINDTCGHIAGDEFLRQLSRLLASRVRTSDTLARLGGDEFAILLDACSLDSALAITENIRQMIAGFKFKWEDKYFEISVSIGVAVLDEQITNAVDALAAADAACYTAKHEGRNQIQVFKGKDALINQRDETVWVQKITRALEEHHFRLYYQKIIPAAHAATDTQHYEILLRMVDEHNQIITPTSFIPAAERYGLMPSIDRWVVTNTLLWLKLHPPQLGNRTIYSINLSGDSLGDLRLLDFIVEQLDLANLPAGTIGFEVTETVAIANLSHAMHFISTLKAKGCLFSLDDFGSGMSSYAYLKNLDVDFLKIDGAFVRNMTNDPIDMAMVESINRIGHVMGIQTIAEFVENEATYQILIKLGVDYAQGYRHHKPEPLDTNNHLAVTPSND
jgi:diguanylate cyclase (GGDEF)-like protein/PAS domain S-box-containing protein